MKPRNILFAIPGLFLAITAMATGSHAGGHGGVDEIGKPGIASNVTSTVTIDMTDDMRFHMPEIAVQQGETIRFITKNSGQIKHEMVLGTTEELQDHYEAMKKNPEMAHADDNMVMVAPGRSGELIWHFTKAGKVDFACLQPGHFDAGMKGVVNVASSKTQSKGNNHVNYQH